MISSRQIAVRKLYTLKGHKDCLYTLEKAADPASFFSAGGDGMVVQWNTHDPEQGRLIAKVSASVYALHYIPVLNHLVIGQNYEGIHVVDVHNKKALGSVKLTSAAIFDIQSYRDMLLVASGDGVVTLLSYKNLKIIRQLKASEKSARSISVNPQAMEFAVGYSDHTIRIFDLLTHKLKKSIEAHGNSVFSVRYSPDYRWLLSGGRDAHLKIWDTAQQYSLHDDIVAHMYAINHIEFRPDNKYFVTCSMDKAIKVWDAQRFRLLKVIDKSRYAGHGTSVNRLLWMSNNDNTLLSASDDSTISAWHLEFNEHTTESL